MATFLQDRNWLDPAKCCMAGEDGRIQSGKMGRKFSLTDNGVIKFVRLEIRRRHNPI